MQISLIYILMVAGTRNVGSLHVGDLLGALPSSGSNRTKKTRDVKGTDRMAVSRSGLIGRKKKAARKLTMGSKKQRRTARQKRTVTKLMDSVNSMLSSFKF